MHTSRFYGMDLVFDGFFKFCSTGFKTVETTLLKEIKLAVINVIITTINIHAETY